MLCGMFCAASPRHICSNVKTFLQGHCLHGKFGCLSCTSKHCSLHIHIWAIPESSSWAGTQSPEAEEKHKSCQAYATLGSQSQKCWKRSAWTMHECHAVCCTDSKAGENRLSLHRGRLECVGVERESEPAQPSIHPCRLSCCFQLCRGLVCSVQLKLCTEMKLWAAAAQSQKARTGPC